MKVYMYRNNIYVNIMMILQFIQKILQLKIINEQKINGNGLNRLLTSQSTPTSLFSRIILVTNHRPWL